MAKLILDIEPTLIDNIKTMAEKKHISLSELTTSLFRKEVAKESQNYTSVSNEDIPDWVKNLTLSKEPIQDFDDKEEYGDHLMRKYRA